MSKIIAIYDIVPNNLFGIKNKLPWNIPEDLQNFKKLTTNSTVIMGRNTYMSLPDNNRPLKNRHNIVVSSTLSDPNVTICISLEHAISYAKKINNKYIFIIGGVSLLEEALDKNLCEVLLVSDIYNTDPYIVNSCKIFGPVIPDSYTLKSSIPDISGKFTHLYYELMQNCNMPKSADTVYFELLDKVLTTSSIRTNRTDVSTKSIFGHHMRFDLRNDKLPLLTTKKMPFKSILEELLWFLSGSTDSNELSSKIWKGNTSREFLDSRGLNYREGLIGPMYGYQWRFFNAEYDSETGKPKEGSLGVDQLQNVLNLLKNDPYSRRIMMTAYNPAFSTQMVLDPCHVFIQFYVSDSNELDPDKRPWLSSQLYQRSTDIGLGLPFNIASYSLLTIMLAKIYNFRPLEFIHTSGDAHIYENHIEALTLQRTQLENLPACVKLNLPESTDTDMSRLLSIKISDFELFYEPGIQVNMKMAV
jgi:dihydrofolate reductase/thymidylate synthase